MRFYGNCKDIIDWNSIIVNLEKQEPAYVGPRHKLGDPIAGIDDISYKWKEAGYVLIKDGGSAGWDMFFPGINFDRSIVETFGKFAKIDPESAWISRVNPGCFAPWHWDANDNEELYSTLPEMNRFSCHISEHRPGQAFVVDNQCIYNYNQGDTYIWDSRRSWHAGSNFGYQPKYIFNIFGRPLSD
jgi:hypothetical protein